MSNHELYELIFSYEALAALQDAAADYLVAEAERRGWSDDLTQAEDNLRHQAATSRMLAQEVRDGLPDNQS